MSPELAKDLRNAGFPNIQDLQHRQGRQFLASVGRVSVYSLGELAPRENWFIPTLDELIEACEKKQGYHHFSLEHPSLDGLHQLKFATDKPAAGPIRQLPKSRSLFVVGIEETMTRCEAIRYHHS